MNLQPKTIDPGWSRRWTRQSVELFRRAPGLAIGIMALFSLVNVLIPQPIALNVPLTVFMVGLLFSGLRAVDQDSGNILSATWEFFRHSVHDLAYLARDAFLVMLAFSLMIGLFFVLYSGITHGAGAVISNPSYLHLPVWLREGVRREESMLVLGIFLPGVMPLVFLTLYVGNQPLLHYQTGFRAIILNLRLAYGVFMFGLLACSLLEPLLRQIPSLWIGLAMMLGCSVAFWWFGTWGYLWCREMFEGTRENAKETAKRLSHVHAAA